MGIEEIDTSDQKCEDHFQAVVQLLVKHISPTTLQAYHKLIESLIQGKVAKNARKYGEILLPTYRNTWQYICLYEYTTIQIYITKSSSKMWLVFKQRLKERVQREHSKTGTANFWKQILLF